MRLFPSQLSNHLSKQIACLYVLYGNESFLVEESATLIKAHIQQQGECELIKKEETRDLAALLDQPSLFSSQKIIELKIPKPTAALMAEVAELLEKPYSGCFVIIESGLITKQQQQAKWFKALEQKGIIIAHWPLQGMQYAQWLDERARRNNLNMSPEIRQRLIAFTEGNCLAGAQEIDRLRLLSEDQTYIVAQNHYEVSELCEAALLKQPERVVKIVSYLKNSKEALQLVVWTLGQTLRALNHCASQPRERHSTTLIQSGIRPQLHALYSRAVQESPASRWLVLITTLSWIDKQLKSGNEQSAWQKLLDVSLELSGSPIF